MRNIMNQIFFYHCGSLKNLNIDLVGYFKFENNVIDSTGVLPSATGTGTDFVSGKVGNSIRFDANTDRVDIPDSDNLSFTTGGGNDLPFSISMWVYFTAFTSGTPDFGNWLINKRNTISGGDEWQIALYNNQLLFNKIDRSNNIIAQGIKTSSNPFLLNNWYHIVCTDNGSKLESGMKIYINSSLQSTITASQGGVYTGMPNGNSITRLGLNAWDIVTPRLRHQGYIDELSIWKNRTINQDEVSFLYNSGTGKTYPL